jgi:hypothetical protein
MSAKERTSFWLTQRTFDGIDATLPWYDARKACGVTLPQARRPWISPGVAPSAWGRAGPMRAHRISPRWVDRPALTLPPAWRWPAPFGGRSKRDDLRLRPLGARREALARLVICVDMGGFSDAVAGLRADLDANPLTKGVVSSDQARRGYKAAIDAALGRGLQALTEWIEGFR